MGLGTHARHFFLTRDDGIFLLLERSTRMQSSKLMLSLAIASDASLPLIAALTFVNFFLCDEVVFFLLFLVATMFQEHAKCATH